METAKKLSLVVVIVVTAFFVYSQCCAGEKQIIFMKPVELPGTYYMNGEKFLELSEHQQAGYAMGILDGYLAAPIFGADPKYLKWIASAIKGKTSTQMAAILVKYLRSAPENWDRSVSVLMFSALVRAFPE